MKKYKVLFCDLDGTLIETISGATFPKGIWDMKFKFDVLDAIKEFAPTHICIVSNQGGIEKGFVNEDHFDDKFQYIINCLAEYTYCKYNIGFYCKSNDKNCCRRKPNVGLLEMFFDDCKNISKDNCYCLMIGDASGLEGQFSDTDKRLLKISALII